MKKFLSLLLALTMVMSLVVVPARAADDITGTMSVKKGETVTLTAPDKPAKVTVDSTEYTVTEDTPMYSWTSGKTSVATVPNNSTGNTVVVSGVSAGSATIKCEMTVKYTIPTQGDSTATTGTAKIVKNATVTVEDAFLTSDVKSVTVFGRTYNVSSGSATVYTYGEENLSTANWSATLASGYRFDAATYSSNKLSVKAADFSSPVEITIESHPISSMTLTVNSDTSVLEGSKLTLTVSNSNTSDAANCEYVWSYAPKAGGTSKSISLGSGNKWNLAGISAGVYTVTCTANYGTATNVAHASFDLTIEDEDDYSIKAPYTSYTLQDGDTLNLRNDLKFVYKTTPSQDITTGVSYSFSSNKTSVATVTASTGVVTAVADGTATITVTVTYTRDGAEKTYTKDITVEVVSLSAEFDKSVENGDDVTYDDDAVVDAVVSAINKVYGRNTVSSSDIATITVKSTNSTEGDLYIDGTKVSSSKSATDKDITFDAYEGFIGSATIEATVTTSKTIAAKRTFDVTLYVPVTSAGTDIKASVTGASSSSSVSFDVSDVTNGDYLYIKGSGSKASFKPSSSSFDTKTGYDGTWPKSGTYTNSRTWERFSYSETITIPASEFPSNGKLTLYVVSVDSDGVATVGTVEVSQKSYTIEYNVVAGESVTFNQADFEALFKEYAEDNGDQSAKRDYPYVEYSHVELISSDLPATKTEGDLYYGSSVLTSKNVKSEKFEDMDKMSFTAISKIKKDTVTIPVTLVGTKYTKSSDKTGDPARYPVSVVISVVNEDIKYTVGVNDSVTFDAKDFADYLNDYQTSYKKSTLDYVEFSLGRNSIVGYTSGALYQSYSTYYAGELAESSDKFYYEPSKKQLDLDEVTYVTTRWAEAGKTVYIPFTVYGTKNEKAEGTVAIEIKNAMNFTDVVQGRDYFYDSVQWAVNNDITNGTSTTTFSPLLGCTRAQIVTFLWRAAGSPEPTSSKNPFKDVNSVTHADYYKAILWAVSKGITDGTTPTTFSPDATCTRAQIVTFLYRYANSPATYGSLSFKDVSKTTHSAYYNAILWAVNKNITTGNGNNTFAPEQTCNRAEAVTFLYRYFN